jgi:uncharacterized protein (UPF0332 family)
MTEEERKEIVALRLENADTSLLEAKLLFENGFNNASVNRMYYASYYAVTALLTNRGIVANTHAGVRQMLGLHFTKNNLISISDNAFFSDLFARRHSGDYDVFISFDKEVVSELIPQTAQFIQTIKDLIYR